MKHENLYTQLLALGEEYGTRVGRREDARRNPHLPLFVALCTNEEGLVGLTFAGGSSWHEYGPDNWTTPEDLEANLKEAFKDAVAVPGMQRTCNETRVDMSTVHGHHILCAYCKEYLPRSGSWVHQNDCGSIHYLCEDCAILSDEEDPIPTLLLREGEFIPVVEYDEYMRKRRIEIEEARQSRENPLSGTGPPSLQAKREEARNAQIEKLVAEGRAFVNERQRRRAAEAEADAEEQEFRQRQHPQAPFLQVLEGGGGEE